jgi:hypothetical protein
VITTNGLNVPEGWGQHRPRPGRVQTVDLKLGDAVATLKVFTSKANNTTYVRPAGPGARGNWRTVEDIVPCRWTARWPADRLVYFTDGAVAAVKSTDWWAVRRES